MKYKVTTIIEDKDLFNTGESLSQLSKRINKSLGYLWRVANNQQIVSEETYLKLKKLIQN